MKFMNTTCILTLLFFLSAASGAQVSSNTYGKPITVQSGTIRIDTLLNHFARQTGVEFSFSTIKVRPSQTITVPRSQQSLSQWLKTLQQNLGINHKVVGNHIILYEVSNSGVHTQPTTAPATKNKTGSKGTSPMIRIHIDSSSRQSDTAAKQSASGTSATPAASGAVTRQPASLPAENASAGKSASEEVRGVEAMSLATQTGIKPKTNTPSTSPAGNARPAKTSGTRPAQPPATTKPRNETIDKEEDAAPDDEAIQLLLGYSFHTSGDYDGIVAGGSYAKYVSQRLSLTLDLRGTINWSQFPIFDKDQLTGQVTDRSIRLLTAGVQLGILGGFSPVRSAHHEVLINLGPFGRFQSCSSGSDGYSIYPPRVSNLPLTVVEFQNIEPHYTISLGALLQVQYRFTFGSGLMLSVAGGFQMDTNDDMIHQAGITVGKRF